MKSRRTIEHFIELRALGKSYDEIVIHSDAVVVIIFYSTAFVIFLESKVYTQIAMDNDWGR